jgi:hypothetical protein
VLLRIDGQPRTGVFAWAAAAERVAGYVLDRRRDGSVAYLYRVSVRGYVVVRHTEIRDGRVTLTTDIYGAIGPRGELYRVTLVLRAIENSETKTTITGSLVGYSHIGDRCRIVRRIAERTISRELAAVLGDIESKARGLYHSGDITEMIDLLIERICR